jgi:long-chain acyl-CoA synthetase
MALIEREQVTRWSAVPTMLWRMHADPARARHDLSSVRSVGYGGSPSSSELARAVGAIFPNVRAVSNAYGLTETGTVFTMIGAADIQQRPGSVGRPFPTAEVCIRDERGGACPAGVAGEITVRGPMLMRGYWGEDPAAGAIMDGWLWTGDIGKLDADGFLYVTDRAKDMIIRGGENIYPVEIEMRLEAHPDIVEAAVIGTPHPTLGEEVRAIVRLKAGAALSVKDVQDWVRESLADFKAPSFVDFRDAPLPRNATGKLMKALLSSGAASRFEETL